MNNEDFNLDFPENLDPGKIPTFTQLPLGRLEFEIKNWNPDTVKFTKDGTEVEKAVVKVQLTVAKVPDEFEGRFVGLPTTETFWIGSDTDPLAKHPATWNANAGKLFAMLKKAKVATPAGLKFRNIMDASVGAHVLGEVKEVKKGKSAGRHNIMGWLSVGEKPLEAFGSPEVKAEAPSFSAAPIPSALSSFSDDNE